ncbi:unnamed protein product [Diamesa serratosioi]
MSATQSSSKLILSLYKQLLRESEKFSSYNIRNYAFRRTRDSFKNNKAATDQPAIQILVDEARTNLKMIQRQVIVGNLFSAEKLVIEK